MIVVGANVSFVDWVMHLFSWTRKSLRDEWTHSAKKNVVIGKLVL